MTGTPALRPVIAVVMGVSGTGKSTIAALLASKLGWPMAEGDDFHSAANVAKMHAGHPLTDEDRWPWLHSIADWIGERERAGDGGVVTCSALKRAYRNLLVDGHPDVRFVCLVGSRALLADRIGHREGHFMPASLLDSQLDTLER
ncbi:MAG TPA: gluconokinase, partial [Jatrophihabitantaceae bacterium]|nr:gluconokinase [Jatrophihabitantaceae bacterium]